MNKIPLHFSQLTVTLDKLRGVSEMKIKASFILHFSQLTVTLQNKCRGFFLSQQSNIKIYIAIVL